jgi:hypothetical protein
LREWPALTLETGRVLVALYQVERQIAHLGPKQLLEKLRAQGMQAPERNAEDRERLRKVIGWLDRRLMRAGNCYRRALVEIGMDRGAAREALFLGFNMEGEKVSGHAWIEATAEKDGTYQVCIRM